MDERQDIINRYESIVKKWNTDGDLIRLFPEKYKEICMKLQALKNGVEYTITESITKKLVEDMGAMIWGMQQYNPLDANGGVVKSIKNSNYENQTDIPEFVDKIIKYNI